MLYNLLYEKLLYSRTTLRYSFYNGISSLVSRKLACEAFASGAPQRALRPP